MPDDVPSTAPPAGTTQQLVVDLYDELCVIARRVRHGERPDHTLQTTALVHEAFLRLAEREAAAWRSRAYFLGAAAQTMRRVLVDYARGRNAGKRNAGARTTLVSDLGLASPAPNALDVLALNDVLARLERLDARQAQVAELRVFGGFEIEEVAEIVGVSPATVKRDWRFAKAWLACALADQQ